MRPVVTAEKPLAKRYVDDYIYRFLNRPQFFKPQKMPADLFFTLQTVAEA